MTKARFKKHLFTMWCLKAFLVFYIWLGIIFLIKKIHPFFLILYTPTLLILLLIGVVALKIFRQTNKYLSDKAAVGYGVVIGLLVDFFYKYSVGWFLFSGLGESQEQVTYWSNLASFGINEWLNFFSLSASGALSSALIAYGLYKSQNHSI